MNLLFYFFEFFRNINDGIVVIHGTGYDPDNFLRNPKAYNYSWYCLTDSKPCFNDSIASLPYIAIDPSDFLPNSSLNLFFDFSDSSRNARSPIVTLFISSIPVPSIFIVVNVNNMLSFSRITSSDHIWLFANASSSNARLNYQWVCLSDNFDIQRSSISVFSPNLVIESGVLIGGLHYIFGVRVWSIDSTAYTTTSITIYVSPPPAGGSCFADPPSGFSIDTLFTLKCNGFVSDAFPLSYTFQALPLNRLPIILSGAQAVNFISCTLPESSFNSTEPLVIESLIADSFGAITTYRFNVTVNQPNNLESALISGLTSLEISNSVLDPNAAAQFIVSISQILSGRDFESDYQIRNKLVNIVSGLNNVSFFTTSTLTQSTTMLSQIIDSSVTSSNLMFRTANLLADMAKKALQIAVVGITPGFTRSAASVLDQLLQVENVTYTNAQSKSLIDSITTSLDALSRVYLRCSFILYS